MTPLMTSTRLAASLLVLGVLSMPLSASADCARKGGVPERYELIELPRINDDAARSDARAITDAGDILIRSFNHSVDRQVDSVVLAADGSFTTVENIFGTGLIFADTLHENGFVSGMHTSLTPTDPRNTTTPVILDGRGNGLTNEKFCAAPEGTSATLRSMVVSASGEHRVGLFSASDSALHTVATCAEAGSTPIFSSAGDLELIGVTNKGRVVGNRLEDASFNAWMTDKNGQPVSPFKQAQNVKIISMTHDGDLFALKFGDLKVDGMVKSGRKVQSIDYFGETGWNATHGVMGQCGEIVGRATQTSYEEFSQLDEDEKQRIRSYTDLINDWDSRRDQAAFIWSKDSGARRLTDALSAEPGWTTINITAINASGVMVGSASDPDGVTRAIKLAPIK